MIRASFPILRSLFTVDSSLWPEYFWNGNACMHFVTTTVHYNDVIMSRMVSEITSLASVYSIVYWGTDQRKHQRSVSLAFVRGIHRSPANSPHKRPVTRKMFPFDGVIVDLKATHLLALVQTRISICKYQTYWYLTLPEVAGFRDRLWHMDSQAWMKRSHGLSKGWGWFHHKCIGYMDNDFLSRVRRFGNGFHEWRTHELKSLPYRLRNGKIVIRTNPYIILFLTSYFVSWTHEIYWKQSVFAHFAIVTKDGLFLINIAITRSWGTGIVTSYSSIDLAGTNGRNADLYSWITTVNIDFTPPDIHGLACKDSRPLTSLAIAALLTHNQTDNEKATSCFKTLMENWTIMLLHVAWGMGKALNRGHL